MAEPVKLLLIDEFRKALHNYQMSEHAQQVLADSRLVVFSGLAGGGRNSVIRYLVEHSNYYFFVSDTTRPPKLRDGVMEQDGVNYNFRKEADMLRDIQNGEFVEAEIIHNQQVSGTSIRELERANNSGLIVLHEAEFGGTQLIAKAKPDAFIVGLLPPTYEEWLRRFQGREEIHDDEFKNRLQTAEKVLEQMLGQHYFKFVVNETIPQCANDIIKIVNGQSIDEKGQHTGRQVAQALLIQVQQHLVAL